MHYTGYVTLPPSLYKDKEDLSEVMRKVLLPWHEYESTGRKEYTTFVEVTKDDVTEDSLDMGAEFDILRNICDIEFIEDPDNTDLSELDEYFTKVGGSYAVYRRTNPDSEWDNYELGGRFRSYSGAFILKDDVPWNKYPANYKVPFGEGFLEDTRMLVAQKKDIDWDAMFRDKLKHMNLMWDRLDPILQGEPFPSDMNSPVIQRLKDSGILGQHYPWDTFLTRVGGTREEALQRALGSPWTQVIVHHGTWYAPAHASLLDEREDQEWERTYKEVLDSIPDDYYLFLMDFHI
jgi:hypothetical protein